MIPLARGSARSGKTGTAVTAQCAAQRRGSSKLAVRVAQLVHGSLATGAWVAPLPTRCLPGSASAAALAIVELGRYVGSDFCSGERLWCGVTGQVAPSLRGDVDLHELVGAGEPEPVVMDDRR